MHKQCESEKLFEVTPLKANYKRAVVATKHLSPADVQYYTYLMNIELNFVHNSNVRLGNYRIALESFLNVISVKPDHAIAHHYAARCYEYLGSLQQAAAHDKLAARYVQESRFWDTFIEEFSIPIAAFPLVS